MIGSSHRHMACAALAITAGGSPRRKRCVVSTRQTSATMAVDQTG